MRPDGGTRGGRASPLGTRSPPLLAWSVAVLLLIGVGADSEAVAREPEGRPAPYLDETLDPHERARDLLGRMTLEEKVGQLAMINLSRLMGDGEWDRGPIDDEWARRLLVEVGAGAILAGGGAAPEPNTVAGWLGAVDRLQRLAVEETRLGIPILFGTDAVHGHNNLAHATLHPHNIGLAATFDPALVAEVARATAAAAAATGVSWNFSPVADLGLDPRWGRFYETFGPSPSLVSPMVEAHVAGQREVPRLAATAKHFIGYGLAPNGRDRAPASVTTGELESSLLPTFEAAIGAGVQTVMANSGAVNGVPVHASPYLLEATLRDRLGFEGVVVSDWADVEKLFTVHRVAVDYPDAIRMAIAAGVDVVMVPHDGELFANSLTGVIERGELALERLDQAVLRVLALKFALGLFEEPYAAGVARRLALEGMDERALAEAAALRGITLLANRERTLPLAPGTRVLVAGPAADDPAMQLGGWTVEWQGVARGDQRVSATTLLEGLRLHAPPGVAVEHVAGPSVTGTLRALGPGQVEGQGATVILALGEPPYAEGPGDSGTLGLPEEQLRFAREVTDALRGTGVPIVLVLFAGRPLILPDWLSAEVDALLMAYLPGSEGGSALARILLGESAPSGRLPFDWPRSAQDLPLGADLPSEGSAEPLYRLGHGLSYTGFRYRDLVVGPGEGGVAVAVTVENTGRFRARHVVLVFCDFPPGNGRLAPQRRLVGFTRVDLEPGESARVTIPVDERWLQGSTADSFGPGRTVLLPGEYRFTVGPLSVSRHLSVPSNR